MNRLFITLIFFSMFMVTGFSYGQANESVDEAIEVLTEDLSANLLKEESPSSGKLSVWRVVKSVVPGYCQCESGHPIWGTAFAGAISGAVVGAIVYHNIYDSRLEEYNKARGMYESAIAKEDIRKYYEDMEAKYDDTITAQKWRLRLGVFAAACWGVNIGWNIYSILKSGSNVSNGDGDINTANDLFNITKEYMSIRFCYRF